MAQDRRVQIKVTTAKETESWEERLEELTSLKALKTAFFEELDDVSRDGIDIHALRNDYIVFSKRKIGGYPKDVGFVKIWSKDEQKLNELNEKVAQIKQDEIDLNSVLYSIGLHRPPTYDAMLRRGLQYLGEAYNLAIQGQPAKATGILRPFIKLIEDRRDSYNRMWYTWANLFSLLAIAVIWALIRSGFSFDLGLNRTEVDFSKLDLEMPIGANGQSIHLVNALVLGAIGAFFSVQSKIKTIKISHAITRLEIAYTGFVRVPVGLIAAGVTVLLVEGDWILGNVQDELKLYSVYLFAFIAGFSEQFVPNALQTIEDSEQKKLEKTVESQYERLQTTLDNRLKEIKDAIRL